MSEDWQDFAGPQNDPLSIDAVRNRRQRFKERARIEYLQGAEEAWRRRNGRPMTKEELERVLRRYPGAI